jgi:hypothetical protein
MKKVVLTPIYRLIEWIVLLTYKVRWAIARRKARRAKEVADEYNVLHEDDDWDSK